MLQFLEITGQRKRRCRVCKKRSIIVIHAESMDLLGLIDKQKYRCPDCKKLEEKKKK